MSVIHVGTSTTLAAVPKADCSNSDVAYIWLESFQRKMVFDITATNATDVTNHPYYVRPNDYSTAGVWVEDVGADQPEAWSADQIITGKLTSTNWSTIVGSQLDLDAGTIKLGGSSSPAFSVNAAGVLTATGATISGTLTATSGTIGGFTLAATTLTAANLLLDAGNQRIKLGTGNDIISLDAADATYRLAIGHATYGSAPFRVTKAGVLIATGATVSGTITTSNITATGGTIGGFTISASEGLYSGSGSSRVQMKAGAGFWAGATAFSSAPFRVSAAGILVTTSGTVGGWTIGATSLTSTNIGLHNGTNAEILLGHATTYASAKIGFKNDGSGKLANNNLYWDTSGNLHINLDTTSSTNGIIFKGSNRFIHNYKAASTSGFNLFVGELSGNFTMSYNGYSTNASYNLGVGYQTLQSITHAGFSVAIGYQAGQYITTGNWNSLVGYRAGYGLSTGYSNVFVGHQAGEHCTTGHGNIGIGYNSCGADDGYQNTCIGEYAGQQLDEGNWNTIMGCYAGENADGCDSNVLIGNTAAENLTSGSYNVCVGSGAGRNLSTGATNIMLGRSAGYRQTDGVTSLQTPGTSIYIGYQTLGSSGTPANEIVIGATAVAQGSNTIMLGNSSITGLYCYDTSISSPSDKRIKKEIVGLFDSLNFINRLTPITYKRKNPLDWSSEIRLPEYTDREIVAKDKKTEMWFIKKEKVHKRPDEDERNLVGLIAQDVEQLMKEEGLDFDLVKTSPNGMKAIAYGNLVMPLIKAVQELTARIETLEGGS